MVPPHPSHSPVVALHMVSFYKSSYPTIPLPSFSNPISFPLYVIAHIVPLAIKAPLLFISTPYYWSLIIPFSCFPNMCSTGYKEYGPISPAPRLCSPHYSLLSSVLSNLSSPSYHSTCPILPNLYYTQIPKNSPLYIPSVTSTYLPTYFTHLPPMYTLII